MFPVLWAAMVLRSSPALLSVSTGVPAAPNRPIAQERSCTSVILRWLPPASTGNCTISGYTVEYREEGVLLFFSIFASVGLQGRKPETSDILLAGLSLARAPWEFSTEAWD